MLYISNIRGVTLYVRKCMNCFIRYNYGLIYLLVCCFAFLLVRKLRLVFHFLVSEFDVKLDLNRYTYVQWNNDHQTESKEEEENHDIFILVYIFRNLLEYLNGKSFPNCWDSQWNQCFSVHWTESKQRKNHRLDFPTNKCDYSFRIPFGYLYTGKTS